MLDVVRVQLRVPFDGSRAIAVMRDRVMRLGHADLRIRPLADLARHHEREHARQVRLEGERQKIEHQRDVLDVRLGHADRRARHVRLRMSLLLRPLDPPFDLPDVLEVLVEPRAVA